MDKKFSLKSLALPIYFDMILRLATGMINTYMVSLVSVDLVGALGAGNEIFGLFVTIFNFLGVGCSVLVAQALGAKDTNLAVRAIHISITFNLILGLVCSALVFFNSEILLEILQIPAPLIAPSHEYLRVIAVVFFIDAVAIVMAAIIRVYGFAKEILFISLVMNLVSIVGNYFALFSPFGLPFYGLSGVGVSTAIGRIVGVLILFFVMIKLAKIRLNFVQFFKFDLSLLRKILSVGLPSAGENLLWVAQYLVAFAFVAKMGEASLSVQTIYFQISSFVFFGGSAISVANEIIVGRLVGAKKMLGAYKQAFVALKFGLISTGVFVMLVYFLSEKIMDLFNLTPQLKELMRPLFLLSVFLELGRTLNIVMVNALRASGDARFPMMMGVIFMWGVSVPLGYFLGIHCGIGILGVWLGFFVDEWLRGLANTWRWRSKKWQNKRLVG